MIADKSKQLYAKMVMNGIGHLDDDLILEAREHEPASAESTTFNIKKYAIGVAVFLLLVGSLVLFPYLAGGKGSNILPIHWSAADDVEIKVALNQTDTAGEYRLTFTGIEGLSRFYFRPDRLPDGCRVLLNGVTPETDDGYYVIDLSALPEGTSSVDVILSGLTKDEAEAIRYSIRLSDSGKATSYHPALEG